MHNIIFFFVFSIISFRGSDVLSKGQPSEWQISFQEAASPLMQKLIDLHDFVFWIITFITLFVFFISLQNEIMGVELNKGANFRDCEDCPMMTVIAPGSFIMGSNKIYSIHCCR